MNELILIIDDDHEILDLLDLVLAREDYIVLRADKGEDAMALFQSNPIDLVITDMSMPGMGGLEVLKRVKQLDPDMEVIVLTGNATFENAVQALKEDGAFNYLTKPLDNIEDLLFSAKRAIEKRKLRSENRTLIEELKNEVVIRKRVENQLWQSKTNLQSVFDGISEPLIMVDRDMAVKVLNEAAKAYTGLACYRDIIEKPCYAVLAGRSDVCENCRLPMAFLTRNPATFERRGLKDPARIETVVIYPIHSKIENEGSAIIRISDITEERKIEEQLMRADRLASLGQLSGGIAHEIRNPLASITLFTDILSDTDKYQRSAQETELFVEIKDNINRIEKIIKRVLDFAKPPVATSDDIDLNKLTRESVQFWSSKLRKSNIDLELDLNDKIPAVRGDVIGLQQVINNMVLNAIEAMDEGGSISIRTSSAESAAGEGPDTVYLHVSDTGPGIPKDQQEDIFNPFYTTKPAGTGLGLSISHQIIKRQGGAFSLRSNPGTGTTFLVELPATGVKTQKPASVPLENPAPAA